MSVRASVTHHRRCVVRVHADGGPGGAGHARDGVEGFADVDVEVWDTVVLILGQLVIWGHASQSEMKSYMLHNNRLIPTVGAEV